MDNETYQPAAVLGSGTPKTARFNELLDAATMTAGWVRSLSDHAFALADQADHAGHRQQLLKLADAAQGFADQVSRTSKF